MEEQVQSPQAAFYNEIVSGDDISWKTMILDAVRNHEMDPWDIDISFIASQFLGQLKELQELNFKVSGKVILASALMLKLKSTQFINQDITLLDQLISSTQMDEESELFDSEEEIIESESLANVSIDGENIQLHRRTPLPRKRKVSVYDLIDALEKALEVNKRRSFRQQMNAPEVKIPPKTFDINSSMDDLHKLIQEHFKQPEVNGLTFSQIIPSTKRDDQIYTFIPLLHLQNADKVDLHQESHFADFKIHLK